MTASPPGRGRPLRFLAALTASWVGLRIVLLWPGPDAPGPHRFPDIPTFLPAEPTPPQIAATVPRARTGRPSPPVSRGMSRPAPSPATTARPAPNPARVALALLGLIRFGEAAPSPEPPAPILPGVPRALPPGLPSVRASHLSGSFWLVARSGDGIAPGAVGGQLGGGQAGLRLAWQIDARRRLALAARATTPLGRGTQELATGIEWQPTRLPVRLVAEQRFVVRGGARGGPALGIVGGLGPKPLGAGVTLEAYGQAGAIRRARTEPYADGAVHVAHKLLDLGGARLDLGAGAWGGAQRGAARLDLGPTLAVTVPVAKRSVRLSLDWRERVAGRARPGSGLALTLGADF